MVVKVSEKESCQTRESQNPNPDLTTDDELLVAVNTRYIQNRFLGFQGIVIEYPGNHVFRAPS